MRSVQSFAFVLRYLSGSAKQRVVGLHVKFVDKVGCQRFYTILLMSVRVRGIGNLR